MERKKSFSYQDPGGVNYVCGQVYRLKRKQKEFTSWGLRAAAALERGKRNLQNKVEDTFGVEKVIDPQTGQPAATDARKRQLLRKGVQPTLPEQTSSKPTEIGKDGTVDLISIGKRAFRKAKPVIGKGINTGIDVVENMAYPAVGAVTTPGRTLSKGISKTIENPVAASTYALSYAAPFMGTTGKVIMAVDNAIPNPLQYKAIDHLTPAPIKTRLKNASEKFNSGVGKKMKSFQWGDVPSAVNKLVTSSSSKSK